MKLDPYIGDVRVECAFSTSPDDPAPAFIEISDYVVASQGIKITRGRQDEYASVIPGTCSLTLDNANGYFTAGYAGSPYYPNVKIRKKLRVSFRSATGDGNLLSPNQASMETSVADYTAAGVAAAFVQDATHVQFGTRAMKITWPTAANIASAVQTILTGLTIGRTYTWSAYVYVPSASVATVNLGIAGIGFGGGATIRDAFQRISQTFTATSQSHTLQVFNSGAATAGDLAWVDGMQVDEGSALRTFTTSTPPIFYRYTGYVEEWPTEWPGGGDYSEVRITATDRFKRLGMLAQFRSVIEQEYLSDNPFAYYTLGEPAASTAAGDTSKNGRNSLSIAQLGAGGTFTFGTATGPATDGLMAAQLAPVNNLNGKFIGGYLNSVSSGFSAGQTLECFFLTSTAAAQDIVALLTPFGTVQLRLSVTAAGKLQATGQTGVAFTSAGNVNDGLTHHAAVTQSISAGTQTVALYLDGVLLGTATAVAVPLLNAFSNMAIGGGGGNGVLNGTVSHVACYDAALTLARIADHSTSGATGFAGERSDQRLARYARYVGIPAAEQNLDVGLSTSIAFVDITGQSPLQAMQAIETTESGILYMDGQGRLTFQARSHRYNTTSTLTLNGEDIDPSARFVENDAYLINDVTASRPGGITYRAVNGPSAAEFGTATITPTLLTTSDNEVVDAANWKANQTATPTPRLPNLTVNILTSSALASAVLGLDISSRITLGALPQYAPTASPDMFIEGLTEDISDTGYRISCNTSPATQSGVWQLDSPIYSQLDSSTRLAY